MAQALLNSGADPNVRVVRNTKVSTSKDDNPADKDSSNAEVNDSSSSYFSMFWGCTPLMVAAGQGYSELIWLLVEHGAWLGALDNHGWSAWDWAKQSGFTETASLVEHLSLETSATSQSMEPVPGFTNSNNIGRVDDASSPASPLSKLLASSFLTSFTERGNNETSSSAINIDKDDETAGIDIEDSENSPFLNSAQTSTDPLRAIADNSEPNSALLQRSPSTLSAREEKISPEQYQWAVRLEQLLPPCSCSSLFLFSSLVVVA